MGNLILFGVGILITIVIISSIVKGRKSQKWPTCDALVNSSEVEIKKDYDEDGEHTYYYPRISYTYTVDGETYHGSRYKMLDASMSKRKSHQLVGSYSAGDHIQVFYDPNDPSKSVIETGAQFYLYIFLLLSLGLTIYGAYQYFVS